MKLSTCPELKKFSQELAIAYGRFHTTSGELTEIHMKFAKHRQGCPICKSNEIVIRSKAAETLSAEEL